VEGPGRIIEPALLARVTIAPNWDGWMIELDELDPVVPQKPGAAGMARQDPSPRSWTRKAAATRTLLWRLAGLDQPYLQPARDKLSTGRNGRSIG